MEVRVKDESLLQNHAHLIINCGLGDGRRALLASSGCRRQLRAWEASGGVSVTEGQWRETEAWTKQRVILRRQPCESSVSQPHLGGKGCLQRRNGLGEKEPLLPVGHLRLGNRREEQ